MILFTLFFFRTFFSKSLFLNVRGLVRGVMRVSARGAKAVKPVGYPWIWKPLGYENPWISVNLETRGLPAG